jgi:putative nucleotidyltransferase with HDIG domain
MKINYKFLLADLKSRIRLGPDIFSAVICIAAAFTIISKQTGTMIGDIYEFEEGKVASRDVIAPWPTTYIDEEATKIKYDNLEKQIPAVYKFSPEVNSGINASWSAFCDFSAALDQENARLTIEQNYPAFFSIETIDAFIIAREKQTFKIAGENLIAAVLDRGILAPDSEVINQYNSEIAELVLPSHRGFLYYKEIITIQNVHEYIKEYVQNMETSDIFKVIAPYLIKPFLHENIFFSAIDTRNRVAEAREQVLPVIRTIEKGKKIIKKGFLVNETEIKDLNALKSSFSGRDPRIAAGTIILIFLFYALFVILWGRPILGKILNNRERYFLEAITGIYIIGSVLLKNISPGFEGFPLALATPTALLIMLLAVFMGTRPAIIMALILPLGTYLAGAFDFNSYIIALVSGATASTVLRGVQNRMLIIKAGLQIAVANCFAVIVVLLIQGVGIIEYPILLFWAALNGIFSGMLTLGFLPPLEHLLNAVTPFRLLELSDLNAPVLRKLFTAAPGTYNHSLMVANLAEQACQDIGANALLARVGAYYHDIGKIDNPDYFIENQSDHNRHDEIAPRLSATVIRSHVKLGMEKAHNLGLPKEVIAIISEHHGNSVITWFFNKATEQEEMVNSDDFTYPGNPPRSRESAVVMLADVTEAAVRTLNKPTASKIEKFIHQLFESKAEHGQLSESDLSFRELEIIKKAFAKVLTGYYHSRIEYPKQKEITDE